MGALALALHDVYGEAITKSVALELLRVDGEGLNAVLRLTRQGRFLANEAFVRFLSA